MTGYLRHTTPTSTTAWLVGGHLSEWGTFIGPYPPSPYSHGVIYMPWESDEGEESPFLVVRYEGWTITPPKQEETTVSSEEMVNIQIPREYVEALRTHGLGSVDDFKTQAERRLASKEVYAALRDYATGAVLECLYEQDRLVTLETPGGTIVEHIDPEEQDDEWVWTVVGPGRMSDGRRNGFLIVRTRDWDEHESMDPEYLRIVKEAPNENEEQQ